MKVWVVFSWVRLLIYVKNRIRVKACVGVSVASISGLINKAVPYMLHRSAEQFNNKLS